MIRYFLRLRSLHIKQIKINYENQFKINKILKHQIYIKKKPKTIQSKRNGKRISFLKKQFNIVIEINFKTF